MRDRVCKALSSIGDFGEDINIVKNEVHLAIRTDGE
jgi:hypothetical protein